MTSGGDTWILSDLCLALLISKSTHFLKKKKKKFPNTNKQRTKENTKQNKKHLPVDSIFRGQEIK